MRIKSVESSVVALPFHMGGPKPAFAGRPWNRLEIDARIRIDERAAAPEQMHGVQNVA